MSRIYDNWEKLVGAVLNREDLRRLALCESFSSSISTDFSSRPSFDSVAPSVTRASSQKLDRSYLCSPSSFFLRDAKVIEFEEIRKATKNFQPDMILEEEGSVIIFKGWIHEHYLTAVKPGFGTAVAVHKLLYEGLVACLDFNAKLSDFSLATDCPNGDATQVSAEVVGTQGYADPEYIATGQLSTKSDVYNFGVVLLELICGLRVLDKSRPMGKQYLMDWPKPILGSKKQLNKYVDSRLEGQYPRNEACRFSKIALHCLSQEQRLRPSMAEVVAALEKL